MLYHRDTLKAAIAFASKDSNRPALVGIHVKGGTVEATDGHALVRFRPDEFADKFSEFPELGVKVAPPEYDAILLVDAIKAAAGATAKRGIPILERIVVATADDPAKVKLVATDLDSNHVGESRTVDMPFPNVDQVMPKTAPTLRIGFDVGLLARAFTALSKVAPKGAVPTVVLEFHGPDRAMKFTFDTAHGAADGVIMPVRLPETKAPQGVGDAK